jgi:hypothetical protein
MISYQGHLIDSRDAFLWSNDATREREPERSVGLELSQIEKLKERVTLSYDKRNLN